MQFLNKFKKQDTSEKTMKYNNADLDCLVLWCVEFFEHSSDFSGLALLGTRSKAYFRAEKPIFYAPTDSSDLGCFYSSREDEIHFIAQGTGIQNSSWQYEKIRELMEEKGLTSAEVVGAFPACIDLVGDFLVGAGFQTRIYHVNGTIMNSPL